MSRFIQALCAFILATTPVVALASQATDFERPDAFRHAVNPLIGDASFIARYGAPPAPGTDPQLRVRTHLSFVHELLSQRDTSAMPANLRDTRREHLARLREYIDAGVFPHNEGYRDQNRPCFIDDDGRICAVGYLVEQSAGRDVAERINDKFQYAFLSEIESPELDEWALSSGLSLEELSLIQPCYNPEFNVTVERTGDMTVTIRGTVFEFCCGMSSASFNFGDAMWVSPLAKSYFIQVNASHTFSHPGSYVITGRAISTADCGYQVGEKYFVVNVGTAAMKLSAVKLPGGPPYRVYLKTTDQVHVECPITSVVRWSSFDAPEPTTWYLENGAYRTPDHEYPWSGTRTILVENTCSTNCAPNQAGTVTVNANGVSTGAEATRVAATWGAIKAMYR